MQSVTTKFLAQTRSSGKVVVVADLYTSNTLVSANIPVTSASVSMDITADILRSANMTIVSPYSASQSITGTDLLRSEIVLRVGYDYGLNQRELVSMGRYMVWSASIDFTQGNILELELFDRAKYLAMSDIGKPIDLSGSLTKDAIQTLLNAGMPNPQTITFAGGLQNPVLAGGTTFDTNYLESIQGLADSIGGVFIFDVAGLPKVIQKPKIDATTTAASAVFDFTANGSNSNITHLSQQITREDVYNGFGVYGVSPDGVTVQPFAEVYDLNTSSKTYWNGPFGKSFRRIDNPNLLSSAECLAAANLYLAESISNVGPAELTVLPNPALEPTDIVTLTYPNGGSTEVHRIQSIHFDIDSMEMQISTAGRG